MFLKYIVKTDDKALQSYYDKIKLYDSPVHPNIKDAFAFANSCRDKEIDRFWSRGTYFWGFIIASFGAYMAVLNAALKDGVPLCLQSVCDISFSAKAILFVLSFVCFIFCLSWQLVHKASKYWQENWEIHIGYLEKEYIGKIYETHLNTAKKGFGWNPLSKSPYDFSVSKISLFCSMLLTFISGFLWLFHLGLMICDLEKESSGQTVCLWLKVVSIVVLFCLQFLFLVFYSDSICGNKQKKNTTIKFDQSEQSLSMVE